MIPGTWVGPKIERLMPDRLRLPFAVDAATVRADLDQLAGTPWTRHFVPQNFDGDWSVIPLRAPHDAEHPIMMIAPRPGCDSYVDTPLLGRMPHVRDLLARLACPLHSVRLMRLGPGSVIKEHTDYDLSYEDGAVRLHIPLVTNDDVDFRLNGRRVVLAPGEVWYLRLSDPHSVTNAGATARIHLVVDTIVNDWLAALFERAAGSCR